MEENLILIILLASGGMLFLVLAVVLFVITYQRKLLSQKLQIQENEKNYQKELLKSSVDIMESERRRIAKDLHDEIGASLTALKIYTGQVKQHLQHTDKIQHINSQSRDLIEQTIQNIRTITQDLLPATLEHFGLVVAIQETCDLLQEHPQTRIFYTHQLPETRLQHTLELALYRILRELLNNTFKYAEACEVHIQINYLSNTQEVQVSYRDNGKGFNFQGFTKQTSHAGLGLKSMETRVQSIGGSIQFDSRIQEGTFVHILAPAIFVTDTDQHTST